MRLSNAIQTTDKSRKNRKSLDSWTETFIVDTVSPEDDFKMINSCAEQRMNI